MYDWWLNFKAGKKWFYERDVFGESPYLAYLRSPIWIAKRKRKLRQVGYRCEICGVAHQKGVVLDVHHLNYSNLPYEKLDDLQVLCRSCHDKVHLS